MLSQWDSDVARGKESEEKLQGLFKQQQKLFQQQRIVQAQRLKTIKQLHEQYMKVLRLCVCLLYIAPYDHEGDPMHLLITQHAGLNNSSTQSAILGTVEDVESPDKFWRYVHKKITHKRIKIPI